MLMPTSSEFVALCRAQVALLTQGLGASLGAVYLTEEWGKGIETELIPIVTYPESADFWREDHFLALLPTESSAIALSPRSSRALPFAKEEAPRIATSGLYQQPFVDQDHANDEPEYTERQMVLPLIHEGVVVGLLVTGREDRAWSQPERDQIERIAHTLAIACVLDQRGQWLEHQQHQQRALQMQQRNLLDNLLHQFRNPLTAIRTFGKLLMRRLQTGDPNRDVAGNIVRESDRLQELLQQFDRTIDIGSAEPPLALNPAVPVDTVASDAPNRSHSGAPALLPAANFLTGSDPLTLEPCSIETILRPLLDSAFAIAQERGLTLAADIPHHLPAIQGNAKALREVLTNLIDNALKYTPIQGKVFVWVEEKYPTLPTLAATETDWVAIAIRDTGPGIPEADLVRLFERHYRGVQAQTDIPGTGLGLAIAQDLVRQMRGEIQVISPAVQSDWLPFGDRKISGGPGTLFIVWLRVCDRPVAS